MNGIERIIARIESDSQAECLQIAERAKVQAEEIIASGKETAKREYEAAVAQSKIIAEERRLRLAGSSESDVGKLILASKQKMLNRVYELALEKLCAYPEKTELMAELAFRASISGTETVVMNLSDREKIGQKVVSLANKKLAAAGKAASLTLSDATRDIRGGLYLSNSSIETNCTFELLINAQRQDRAAEVAEMLFR